MELKSGRYPLPERNIHFDLSERFDLNTGDTCFFLRGENGVGKTSFLEKILIPALDRQRIGYLYIGQDIRLQLYTLRALLATLGKTVMGADALEVLKIWITQSRSAQVFILDEFDKYYSDYEFIFDWSHTFIRNYIFVTHHARDRKPGKYAARYRICNIRFESAGDSGPAKKVRISRDTAWQS